jgi:hypothetical protein
MHPIIKPLVVATLLASLAACGDKTGDKAGGSGEAQPTLAEVTSPQAMEAIKKEVARAALPKADKATPLASYVELTSGHQIMFAYLAMAAMPIDYKEIAASYSQDYARTNDEFRKNDLLNALKPKIDAEVAKAGAGRYVRMSIDNPIGKYDFEKKGFPLENGIWESGATRYFHDNSNYRLGFSNGDAFRYLTVTSEESARTIEGLRSQYQALQLVIYGYTQDADLSNKTVKAEIVKVALIDRKGNVLAGN